MAATIEIDEANGAGETLTHGITNSNMGSADEVNTVATSNAIAPSTRTYVKYQKVHVTAMGGSSKINNLKVWRNGALGSGGSHTHVTNARTTSYGGAITYATPTRSAVTGVDQTMPSSVPASANLGIAGSLSGSLTGTGSSDYLAHQIVVDSGATAGSTSTLTFQYDETA